MDRFTSITLELEFMFRWLKERWVWMKQGQHRLVQLQKKENSTKSHGFSIFSGCSSLLELSKEL